MITRLIIRGLVDGALSSLGVVIGASLSNNITIILSAGLSGAVANAFSNVLAAFTAEKTGQYMALTELEKKMMKPLKGTIAETSINGKVLKGGVYDGLFSLIGGILPILPFFFFDMGSAVYIAAALVTALAGFLGYFTSRFSKENMMWSIVKMVGFTLLTAIICVAIQYVI